MREDKKLYDWELREYGRQTLQGRNARRIKEENAVFEMIALSILSGEPQKMERYTGDEKVESGEITRMVREEGEETLSQP